MGTLRGTQIHLCFCKSLIASGSGKEGWLWGGNFQASATETETEPEPRKRRDGRPRDGVTETEGQRTGRWRDGEMERWRDGEVEQGHGRQPSVMHVVTEM